MKRYLLPILLLCFTFSNAQTPCVGGMAGTYPCNGYDLLSFIPFTALGATNSNDSWGWTDPNDGTEYAIVGLDNGTAFLDISDPLNPVHLGNLPTHTGTSIWRDIKVYDNHAFVVSDVNGNHGMQVFDLTRLRNVANPPETFTADTHFSGFGPAHNIVINEDTGYAYGVGADTYSGGPHFINIQNPTNPVAEGGFASYGYTHDAQVVIYNGPDTDYTGREIYVGSNESQVVIVDVTDKANPQGIATVSYTNVSYTHQGWFTEDQRYFIVGDEIDEQDFGFNTRTLIFDLNDLDNPQLSFEFTGPTPATDHNGYVKGDTFYLASYAAGMRVMDISDIENGNITETGYFDVYPSSNIAGYNGAWNVYPYFESGNIMITSLQYSDPNYNGGFYLVRPSTLAIDDFAANSFAISPNPASDKITIESSDQVIISSIAIVDVLGKEVFSENEINLATKVLDISSFSKGMYFVKINDQITKKIIKK